MIRTLRGHKLSNLVEYMSFGELPQTVKDFGEANIKATKELYDFILNNPQASVEIVDNLDTACLADCNQRGPACKDDCTQPRFEIEAAEAYGLGMGMVNCGFLVDTLRRRTADGWKAGSNGVETVFLTYRKYRSFCLMNDIDFPEDFHKKHWYLKIS